MSIKMIVTDIDDTLLTSDHMISEKTKRALLDAQDQGIRVVLASGRPVPAMTAYAKELGLDRFGSHLISYNGAVIWDCANEKTVFEQKLPREKLMELYEISERENVWIHTYSDTSIITDEVCEHIEFESRLTGMPIETVDDFPGAVQGDVIKAMASGDDWEAMVPDAVVEYLHSRGLVERFRREFGGAGSGRSGGEALP